MPSDVTLPPDSSATTPSPTVPVTPAAPVVDQVVKSSESASHKNWLWLALVVFILLGFGVWLYYQSSPTSYESEPTPEVLQTMPTTIQVSTTPEISNSDDLNTIEAELDSTQVSDDTSGYTQMESDLQGL